MGVFTFGRGNLTFENYGNMFTANDGGGGSTILISLQLALISATLASVLGVIIFIISFRELVSASLLQQSNACVFSTYIYSLFNQGYNGATRQATCLAVMCLLITVTALVVVRVLTERKKK